MTVTSQNKKLANWQTCKKQIASLKFIQKTMKTLPTYEKQFQGQLDIEMT